MKQERTSTDHKHKWVFLFKMVREPNAIRANDHTHQLFKAYKCSECNAERDVYVYYKEGESCE